MNVNKLQLIHENNEAYYINKNNNVPAFILVPRKFAIKGSGTKKQS